MARFLTIEPGVMVNLDQIVSIQSQDDCVQLKTSNGEEYRLSKDLAERFWEILHAEGNRIIDGTQPEAETVCDMEIPHDLLDFGSHE